MANRDAARILGRLFNLLAENPLNPYNRDLARLVFSWAKDYDFTLDQMGATLACLALGIAVPSNRLEDEDEPDAVLWPGDRGYESAYKFGVKFMDGEAVIGFRYLDTPLCRGEPVALNGLCYEVTRIVQGQGYRQTAYIKLA